MLVPGPGGLAAFRTGVASLARLGLAAVWVVAGAAKVGDLAESVRAVRAYRLLPEAIAPVVGAALPFVEIALGLLLLVGLGTRVAAATSTLLLLAFVVGISAAAARDLRIDCGCFGGGGQLGAGQDPAYTVELLRDVGLLIVSVLLAVFPRSRWALDGVLFPPLPAPPAADRADDALEDA